MPGAPVPFRDAVRVWTAVGLNSFGGPAGQIAVMHRVLVEERRWVSETRFLHALNYCMLLPGPEAQQLATYIGWLLHGYRGGLVAGVLFVLPGFAAILALSLLYVGLHGTGAVEALFFGLKAAVLAVVAEAVLRIGRRVLRTAEARTLAVAAFAALFFFACPYPLVVLGAALAGVAATRLRPAAFAPPVPALAPAAGPAPVVDAMLDREVPAHARASRARALRVLAVCLALWLGPLAVLAAARGPDDTFVQVGVFFSKAAVVTFGGAYAVLAYLAQQAVGTYGWVAPGEMLDGLGMAETTPGPLIQVVQFVGFLATYRDPGGLSPLAAGVLGAVLTTWVTFVPCFLWIFLGAPYVETLRDNARLSGALSAITAAVVGVIANLAVWLALHVLFAQVAFVPVRFGARLPLPVWTTLDPAAAAITMAALVALLRLRAPMIPTLAACTAAGAAYRALAGG